VASQTRSKRWQTKPFIHTLIDIRMILIAPLRDLELVTIFYLPLIAHCNFYTCPPLHGRMPCLPPSNSAFFRNIYIISPLQYLACRCLSLRTTMKSCNWLPIPLWHPVCCIHADCGMRSNPTPCLLFFAACGMYLFVSPCVLPFCRLWRTCAAPRWTLF